MFLSIFTSSSSFFLHKVMNRMKRQKMRTTNPSRIPATAVTTTSLEPKAVENNNTIRTSKVKLIGHDEDFPEESAPGFVPAIACASFQLQPLTVQH